MIDAGIIAQSMINHQNRSAENAMRLARVSTFEDKLQSLTQSQAEKTAADFEQLFLSQMLTSMFGESLGDDFFGNKETSEIYRSMVVDEYSKQITERGGIGIADYVKKELLKLQEVQS